MENLEPSYRIIRARGRNNLILDALLEITVPVVSDQISKFHPQSRTRVIFDEADNISADISSKELIDLCIQKIIQTYGENHIADCLEKCQESLNNLLNTTVYTKFELDSLAHIKIQSVPKLYAKIVLIREGLWSTIENYFAREDIDLEYKIFFEDSQNWDRNNELFKFIVNNVLQLSEEQIDELFRKAYVIYKENDQRISLTSAGNYLFPQPFDTFV